MVMGEEESSLTVESVASILLEEKVHQLGEKFVLVAGIHLEVPGEDKHITEGMTMRVTLHEELLNAGLRISMLLAMADLLR